LAKQLVEQARRRRGPGLFEQSYALFQQALEHNRLASETYFDVAAYGQMAWIQMELHNLQMAAKRKQDAAVSLRAAIEGFNRVLVLDPGNIDALEHFAYIYSYIASTTDRREDWLTSLEYAKRLLEAEHDNTNAFYFMGIAYENLELTDRAITYYTKTLTYPSTMPAERRMWDRKVIADHLAASAARPGPPKK
jgi:tetratricopeptide (TPR) repeat protein